jgi:hypothetical protein
VMSSLQSSAAVPPESRPVLSSLGNLVAQCFVTSPFFPGARPGRDEPTA